MIIFSDLDRSIIYSNKFIEEFNDFNNEYDCIEKVNNKEISYISLKTIEYLKEIQDFGTFIPTTTRTAEQFRRIDFDNYNIKFKYAITSNGGTILKDNEPLKEWDLVIKDIVNSSGKRKDMIDEFEKYKNTPGIISLKNAGELFFYLVVDKSIFNIDNIKEYIKTLNKNNWLHYISGRKIYFLQKGITKENAINFIINKENIGQFSSIGDSIMDLGMLNIANNSYILKHGELAKYSEEDYRISKSIGMDGTEEVLLNLLEKHYIKNTY